MRENRPSGSEAGVALIPPSLPLSCAAATTHGAFQLAQRLKCARLLALSDRSTAPGSCHRSDAVRPNPRRCTSAAEGTFPRTLPTTHSSIRSAAPPSATR